MSVIAKETNNATLEQVRKYAEELVGSYATARLILDLADNIEVLTKERNALKLDVSRYRFITTHVADEGDMDVLERAFESMDGSDTCTQAEFDTCIDVAIVKEQRQVGVQ